MTNPPILTAFLRRAALLLAAVVLLSTTASAQSDGTVVGRVSDGGTGNSLQGAIGRVVGLPITDYSRADGRFTLAGVPAGAQRIQIDYVGLDSVTLSVTVAGGAIVTVNTALQSQVLKLQAFTVAESLRGQAQAINRQKTASGIVNILSEEKFSNNIGGNIGFTL